MCADMPNVSKALSGCERAFEELVSKPIERFKYRAIKAVGEADAEDVVQNATILAFRKLKTFKGQSKFSSWFYTIGTNCIRMHLRTKKRSRLCYLGDDLLLLAEKNKGAVCQSYSEDQIILKETCIRAIDAVDSLPEGYRDILKDWSISSKSLKDLASKHGLTVPAIKTRINRARAAVKKEVLSNP